MRSLTDALLPGGRLNRHYRESMSLFLGGSTLLYSAQEPFRLRQRSWSFSGR